jgi:hypothetical protein
VLGWLTRMTSVRIQSRSAIYLAGSRCLATGELAIFDRVLTASDATQSGERACRNMVWLSEWLLENLNRDHAFSLDFDAYIDLDNSVARTLVVPLHVWFYASRNAARFEKRLDSAANLLGFPAGMRRAKARRALESALTELHRHGYLSRWRTVVSPRGEKILLVRGKRFTDPGSEGRPKPRTQVVPRSFDYANDTSPAHSLAAELISRGIARHTANELALEPTSREEILESLEWGDHLIRTRPDIDNPPGFYIHLIRNRILPPASFLTKRRQIVDRDRREARNEHARKSAALEAAYTEFRERAIDANIAANLSEANYEALLNAKRQELATRFPRSSQWSPGSADRCIVSAVREDIARNLALPSFEDYCARPDGNCFVSSGTDQLSDPGALVAVTAPQPKSDDHEITSSNQQGGYERK